MDNTLGLILVFSGIALIVGFVILVEYFKEKAPDSRLGKLSQKISRFIDRNPYD